MRAKTTDDLLTEVRARVAAPAANGLLSSTELLELADQELRTELAAILIGLRSEYWLTSTTLTITSGQPRYSLPDRALGMGLRDVTVYDSGGREFNCVQVPADQRYVFTRGQTWAPSGPFAFTLENGALYLLPTPAQSGYTLRLRYYTSPSKLVATTATSYLESASANSLSVVSDPGSSTREVGGLVDVVHGAGMFDLLASELTVTGWNAGGLVISVTPDISADALAIIATTDGTKNANRRDYVCAAGETVYPPIPVAMWPLLVALTGRAYCEAVGDMRGFEAASAMYERKKATALEMMQPRVDGEVMRAVPLYTPLRGGRRFGGRVW